MFRFFETDTSDGYALIAAETEADAREVYVEFVSDQQRPVLDEVTASSARRMFVLSVVKSIFPQNEWEKVAAEFDELIQTARQPLLLMTEHDLT